MTFPTCLMIDAIGVDAHNIPGTAQKVGAYVTGSGIVPWNDAQLSRFGNRAVTINQLPADPGDTNADVCDVETGAATMADAVGWAQHRLNMGKRPAVYVQQSNLTALVDALVKSGVTSADIWLANWNLSATEAATEVENATGPFPVKAVQYASPSSNPTTNLPGTSQTLAGANCDLSIADLNWPEIAPPVKGLKSGEVKLAGFTGNTVYFNEHLGTLGYDNGSGHWVRVELPRV